jgi:hypothetical protein
VGAAGDTPQARITAAALIQGARVDTRSHRGYRRCPLTARSVYNNIQRNAVPSLLVPSLPNMAVPMMAEGAVASRRPIPMHPKSVQCC